MKYQIYLNKETSDIINRFAEADNKKPNTFIKELIEGMMAIAQATANETAKQTEKAKDGKRK